MYGRRPLCSSTDRTLTVPRTHNRFGERSFAVAGSRLWNSLPIGLSLRQISSYAQFRRYLKNHLFRIWEITSQCDAWFSALYKYFYLLTDLQWQRKKHTLLEPTSTINLCMKNFIFIQYSCSDGSSPHFSVSWQLAHHWQGMSLRVISVWINVIMQSWWA